MSKVDVDREKVLFEGLLNKLRSLRGRRVESFTLTRNGFDQFYSRDRLMLSIKFEPVEGEKNGAVLDLPLDIFEVFAQKII